MKSKDFDVPPYILGVLLGDGGLSAQTPSLSTADAEILSSISAYAASSDLRVMSKKGSGYDYYITKKLVNGKKTSSSGDRGFCRSNWF